MYTSNEFVIVHESGNPSNTGADSLEREVSYMSRNWTNAFVTHWVGGGGKVIQIAPTGRASWGAGGMANYRSYAQVELSRTKSRATFDKDYPVYVTLLRNLAKEAGIPVKLDAAGKGIKSHEWVSVNLGGTDHRDPFAYLASWGISKAQFAKDIANGISVDPVKPDKPVTTPKPPAVITAVPKVGDTVKIVKGLYKDSAGNGKSTAMIGKTGEVVRTYGSKKKFLVENWGWADANDVTVSKSVSVPSKPAPTDWSKQYYTVNPQKVKLKKAEGLRGQNDVNWTGGAVGGTYPVGTVFNIKGIKKQSNGLPRLVTESGYLLTANKSFVEKVSSNVPSVPKLKGSELAYSGYYTVKTTTNIRLGAGTGYPALATYSAGQGFYYDSKVTAGGYVWLSYISYSGTRMYVAVV